MLAHLKMSSFHKLSFRQQSYWWLVMLGSHLWNIEKDGHWSNWNNVAENSSGMKLDWSSSIDSTNASLSHSLVRTRDTNIVCYFPSNICLVEIYFGTGYCKRLYYNIMYFRFPSQCCIPLTKNYLICWKNMEMEVALRYTLLTVKLFILLTLLTWFTLLTRFTLFILFVLLKLLYTAKTLANI